MCIYINAHLMVKIKLYTYNIETKDITYIDTIETNKVKEDISK